MYNTFLSDDIDFSSIYYEPNAKKIALERAKYKCEKCGNVGLCGLVIVHHIFYIGILPRIYNILNHPSLRIVLCPSCHAKGHKFGRKTKLRS